MFPFTTGPVPELGDLVRIQEGGIAIFPGAGQVPGPMPKHLVGDLGQVVEMPGTARAVNLSAMIGGHDYEVEDPYFAVRLLEGQWRDRLLHIDGLIFRVLSPLEQLATAAEGYREI